MPVLYYYINHIIRNYQRNGSSCSLTGRVFYFTTLLQLKLFLESWCAAVE